MATSNPNINNTAKNIDNDIFSILFHSPSNNNLDKNNKHYWLWEIVPTNRTDLQLIYAYYQKKFPMISE